VEGEEVKTKTHPGNQSLFSKIALLCRRVCF